MATYTVRDPSTGKTLTLTGDSPPTEQELEQVFAEHSKATSTGTADQFVENVGENAKSIVKGIGHLAVEASKMPGEAIRSGAEVMAGVPVMDTPIVSREKTIAKGAYNAIASIPGQLADVVTPKKWFERPIDQALTAGSVVLPFLKGLKGASALSRVAEEAGTLEKVTLPEKILAKSLRVATGLPEESTITRFKDPMAVKTAFSHPEIAQQVVDTLTEFDKKIGTLDEAANKTLRSSPYLEEGAIPKTDIMDAVKSAKRSIGGAFTKSRKAAVKTISEIEASMRGKLKSTVSESQIKERIAELDNNINWDDVTVNDTNEALVKLRRNLDARLKAQNPAYKTEIAKVEEAIGVRDKMKETFGVRKDPKLGYGAGNSTVSKVKTALREDKLDTQGVIQRFEKQSGQDLTTRIKNANAKADFAADSNQPGKYTRAGAYAATGATAGEVAGQAVGLPPMLGGAAGGAIGMIGGSIAEVYGRGFAGRLVDGLSRLSKLPSGAKYVKAFEQASLKGARNVAVLHATLMRDDPQYGSAMVNVPVPQP